MSKTVYVVCSEKWNGMHLEDRKIERIFESRYDAQTFVDERNVGRRSAYSPVYDLEKFEVIESDEA